MASASDGIRTGEIKVENEHQFIQDMVDEFEEGFEAIKLKKMLLAINKSEHITNITIKEK